MSRFRGLLTAAAVVAGFACVPMGVRGGDTLTSPRVPPDLTPDQVEQNLPQLGNPLNKPITGGSEDPLVVGTEPPPSLEALQATRPGDEEGDGLEPGRADMVRTAGLTYGAQGGLAARSFALNEMLRRYQAQLDSAYDFRTLVLPVGRGQTLMRPPIVSAAQMAFALGDGGQVARETSCIYQITARRSSPPHRPTGGPIWSEPGRRRGARTMASCPARGRKLPTGTSGSPKGGRRVRSKRSRSSFPISAASNATSSAWPGTGCVARQAGRAP